MGYNSNVRLKGWTRIATSPARVGLELRGQPQGLNWHCKVSLAQELQGRPSARIAKSTTKVECERQNQLLIVGRGLQNQLLIVERGLQDQLLIVERGLQDQLLIVAQELPKQLLIIVQELQKQLLKLHENSKVNYYS